MSKESFDKGRTDASKDSARDPTERSSNSIMESVVGSRYYQPASGSAQDRKDYAEGYRYEKNHK